MKICSILSVSAISALVAVTVAGCGGGTKAPSSAGASSTSGTPAASSTPAASTTASSGASTTEASAAQGEKLFKQTCATCHGPNGKGLPHLGKDLTTSKFAEGKTDKQLVDFLKVGRPASDPLNTTHVDMPPRGGNPALTDQDLLSIVMYVHKLEGK